MISATVLVVIFAPLFYVLVEKVFGRKQRRITTGSGDNISLFNRLIGRLLKKGKKRPFSSEVK